MTTRVLLLICCLINSICFTQNATFKGNSEYQHKMHEKAKFDIENLKNGVLLVRLHGRSEEIKYLRNHNKQKRANKIEKKTHKKNLCIIEAFRQHYSFCPVYFFEDTFSTQIFKGDFSNVKFYNDSMKIDPSIRINTANYFIAEHGVTEGDTTSYRHDFYIEKNQDGLKKTQMKFTEENLHVSAFVIRDKSFTQLHKPFPYYAKIFGKNPKRGMIQKKVKQFSRGIENFYKT